MFTASCFVIETSANKILKYLPCYLLALDIWGSLKKLTEKYHFKRWNTRKKIDQQSSQFIVHMIKKNVKCLDLEEFNIWTKDIWTKDYNSGKLTFQSLQCYLKVKWSSRSFTSHRGKKQLENASLFCPKGCSSPFRWKGDETCNLTSSMAISILFRCFLTFSESLILSERLPNSYTEWPNWSSGRSSTALSKT